MWYVDPAGIATQPEDNINSSVVMVNFLHRYLPGGGFLRRVKNCCARNCTLQAKLTDLFE
jgi:hypothetical protein